MSKSATADFDWRASRRIPPCTKRSFAASPPYVLGNLHHHAQLRPLLFLGENIALLGRGEAALRGERELVRRDVFRRLLDAALDVALVLQRAVFRRDETEHHDLVAGGKKAQRLEAAGPLAVVFEEIAVIIAVRQQVLRHRLVNAGRGPGRAENAAG